MDHQSHDIDALLEDQFFKEWVYRPTPELNAYWEAYQKEHPEKIESIKFAYEFLSLLHLNIAVHYPDQQTKYRMFERIVEEKEEATKATNFLSIVWVAASCVLLLFCTAWLVRHSNWPVKEMTYQQLLEGSKEELQEFVNRAQIPVTVTLPDSSEIQLEPGSKISYSKNFGSQETREVYLEGTAFFKVTQNPDSPFVVYVNELITKLLGTSFWISKLKDSNDLLVEVVTGKVAVSTLYKSHLKTQEPVYEDGQIMVTPNQQLLFSRKDISIRKSLVPRPLAIATPCDKETLEFDDERVGKVFQTIEKVYGVEIQYDENTLGKCLVTASLSGEPLYETIGAICEATNARYHVKDTKIVVEGYGCP